MEKFKKITDGLSDMWLIIENIYKLYNVIDFYYICNEIM